MGRHHNRVCRRRAPQRTPKRFRERRPRTAQSSIKLQRIIARLETLLERAITCPLCTAATQRLAEIQRTLEGGRRRQVGESVDVFIQELEVFALELRLQQKGREKQMSRERRPRRPPESKGPPRKLRHSPRRPVDTSLDQTPDVPEITFGHNPRPPPSQKPDDPDLANYFDNLEQAAVGR